MDKNIATFLRQDTKTVSVRFIQDNFEAPENKKNFTLLGVVPEWKFSTKEYTYVTDLDLKVDDLVLVFAQGVPKIVIVSKVHDELGIQPNDDVEYRWIAQKIDLGHYWENIKKNSDITKTVAKGYQQNVRRQFQSLLLGGLDPDTTSKLNNILGVQENASPASDV